MCFVRRRVTWSSWGRHTENKRVLDTLLFVAHVELSLRPCDHYQYSDSLEILKRSFQNLEEIVIRFWQQRADHVTPVYERLTLCITQYCAVDDLNMLNISLYMQYRGSISSRFSTNFEANASELVENLENHEMQILTVKIPRL